MPYKDPEIKKIKGREYASRAEVKERRSKNHKKWREENKDYLKAKESRRRVEKRAQCLVASARTRARKKGIDFDLDSSVDELQAVIDAGVCQFSGLPFDLTPGVKYNSPSLDRIDPDLGYVPGNVRIILHCFNCAFGNWGQDIFITAFMSCGEPYSRSR